MRGGARSANFFQKTPYKDEGSAFYKELTETLEHFFAWNNIPKTGGNRMLFTDGIVGAVDRLQYLTRRSPRGSRKKQVLE